MKQVVAVGQVWPIIQGDRVHCIPLAANMAKVQVDTIVDMFRAMEIPHSNEEFSKLCECERNFVMWPKHDIELVDVHDAHASAATVPSRSPALAPFSLAADNSPASVAARLLRPPPQLRRGSATQQSAHHP